MANSTGARYFTLIQRELQEYKVSLVLTPIVIAGVLAVLMLGSVLFANQITAMGGTFMKVVVSEPGGLPVIRINIDDEAPDDGSGIFYRERLISVASGTAEDAAGKLAFAVFEWLKGLGSSGDTNVSHTYSPSGTSVFFTKPRTSV